jgi:glutathione S-transferase
VWAGIQRSTQRHHHQGPHILGERFTAVDILYLSLFEHARPLIGESAVIDGYLARADRPARRRAIAKGA